MNYEPEGSSVGYAGSSTTWPQGSTFSEDIESSDTELQGTIQYIKVDLRLKINNNNNNNNNV